MQSWCLVVHNWIDFMKALQPWTLASYSCRCLYFCWIYRRSRVHSEVALTLHLFNLVIFICVRSSIFSTHLQVTSWTHLNISHLHLVLLILPVSLLLSPPLFSSYLPFLIFLSIFILNTPTHFFSLHPSLPFSLSPLLSVSLRCALMNHLPLPVNSTDNPGEAVKDHRSALQTGPQATAQEQHANNKPLHFTPSVRMNVRICSYACKICTFNTFKWHAWWSNIKWEMLLCVSVWIPTHMNCLYAYVINMLSIH